MAKGFLKFADSALALLILGPAAAGLMATLHAADGDPYTTPLTSASPAKGALLLLLVLALAGALAVASSRLLTRGRGLCMAGIVMGWASFATGNVRQVLGDTDGPGNLTLLIVEAAVLLPWALLLGLVVEAFSPVSAEELGHPNGAGLPAPGFAAVRASFDAKTFIPSLLAGIVAGGLIAWIACLNPHKGQAIFAAWLGGLAAGWASSYAAATTHHDRHPSILPGLLAIPVLALLACLYMKIGIGDRILDQARAAGAGGPNELFALARILPMDWAAGGIFGVPMGASWAASMIERQHHARDHAAHTV